MRWPRWKKVIKAEALIVRIRKCQGRSASPLLHLLFKTFVHTMQLFLLRSRFPSLHSC